MMNWRVTAFASLFGIVMMAEGQAPPKNPVGHGPDVVAAGRVAFNRTCTACHGVDGGAGERAPALVGDRRFFRLSEGALYDTIENGIPDYSSVAGPNPVPEDRLHLRAMNSVDLWAAVGQEIVPVACLEDGTVLVPTQFVSKLRERYAPN